MKQARLSAVPVSLSPSRAQQTQYLYKHLKELCAFCSSWSLFLALASIMEESFSLPVNYKGKEVEVPVTLRVTGYSPRFIAMVGQTEITIEKDEEGEYRAIHVNGEAQAIDKVLVGAVVATLQTVFG